MPFEAVGPPMRMEQTVQARPVQEPQGVVPAAARQSSFQPDEEAGASPVRVADWLVAPLESSPDTGTAADEVFAALASESGSGFSVPVGAAPVFAVSGIVAPLPAEKSKLSGRGPTVVDEIMSP